MIKVGDKVMVRDPYIRREYHVPPATVIKVIDEPGAFSKAYLLEFDNGFKEHFESWQLKTE